ncbi:MAG: HlyD family efflux transporter periplasmic adaptor subunit [candidate division WS1 bacterium]|nr:HlyD family efflux transporter periplasmic adaptor subunit [candidate division WS1 bacterium]
MAEIKDLANSVKRARQARLRTRLLILGVVVVVLAVGVFWFLRSRRSSQTDSAVRTAKVTRGSLVETISATGTIEAETGANVKIGSQITGRIQRLYVDLGDKVSPGQIIVTLDAPDLAANLESSRRNLAQAESRYQQQLTGVSMQHTQLAGAFEQATESLHRAQAQRAQALANLASAGSQVKSATAALSGVRARLKSAEANLRSAQASARLQPEQTQADIARAKAALSTAQSNLVQTQKGADLQTANAEASLRQAQSNVELAAANLQRQQTLLAKGYVSQQEVDSARNQDDLARQAARSAQNNLDLTRQKITADLQAARDQVVQAQANLAAAEAQTYQDVVRTEAVAAAEASVNDAKASVIQSESQLETARQSVRSAEAQVASAEAEVRNARVSQQVALGNMTQDKLKQKDVQTAYEAMRQARAQVAYQEAQFDKSNIRSPISGTVISLTQQEGETVAAGLAAPTLLEVVDLGRLEVHANVDETDIAQVHLGQAAEVHVDAFPDLKLTGKVSKISSAATLQDNVVTYQVTVALDEYEEGLLKPQMTAEVTLTISRQDDIFLVPNEAVKQIRAETGEGRDEASPGRPEGGPPGAAPGAGGRPATVNQVVVLANGKPDVRTVEIGNTDGTNTAILSGISEGDEVVVAGFDQLGLEQFSSRGQVLFLRSPLGTPTGGGRGR